MYSKNKTLTPTLAALATTLALAACGSTAPTQFYTLAPASTAADGAIPASGKPIFIEVTPVAVPERLARPQLVIRSDASRLDVLEQERWSSPLNNELRDALASGLANRLGAVDVSRGGRPADQPSYRIAVELRDLDAVRGAQVRGDFSWTITRSSDRATTVCRWSVSEPVTGSAAGDVVLSTQKLVGRAVEAIAGDVRAMQSGAAGRCTA